MWLCRTIKKALDLKGKSIKSWKRRDPSTYIYCSLKFKKYCIFISIIAVTEESKSVIILPETAFNEAWEGLIKKIENFINKLPEKKNSITTNKDESNWGEIGEGSYKDVIHKNKWAALEHTNKTDSAAKEVISDKDPLIRSLVGSFQGCDEIPIRNDVRSWTQNTWKGIYNLFFL